MLSPMSRFSIDDYVFLTDNVDDANDLCQGKKHSNKVNNNQNMNSGSQ